jgi:hypothetical protein
MWLPNGQAAIESYFAINYLGAVFVPINTGYRGDLLAHVIDNSDANVIIAHHELAPPSSLTAISKTAMSWRRWNTLLSRGKPSPSSIRPAQQGRQKACCRPTTTTRRPIMATPGAGPGMMIGILSICRCFMSAAVSLFTR